jgi:transposase
LDENVVLRISDRGSGIPAENRIERCFNELKHIRRIATRYDRRANYFLAFIYLACAMLGMR